MIVKMILNYVNLDDKFKIVRIFIFNKTILRQIVEKLYVLIFQLCIICTAYAIVLFLKISKIFIVFQIRKDHYVQAVLSLVKFILIFSHERSFHHILPRQAKK